MQNKAEMSYFGKKNIVVHQTATKATKSIRIQATTDTDSKLALNVVNNLTKQENYEEKGGCVGAATRESWSMSWRERAL